MQSMALCDRQRSWASNAYGQEIVHGIGTYWEGYLFSKESGFEES
jgi:hypothetical protein